LREKSSSKGKEGWPGERQEKGEGKIPAERNNQTRWQVLLVSKERGRWHILEKRVRTLRQKKKPLPTQEGGGVKNSYRRSLVLTWVGYEKRKGHEGEREKRRR